MYVITGSASTSTSPLSETAINNAARVLHFEVVIAGTRINGPPVSIIVCKGGTVDRQSDI